MLPANQDVIATTPEWNGGPLPNQGLEQIAFELFRFKHPHMAFDNSLCKSERDECRQLALQLREKVRNLDRWGIETAHEQLAFHVAQLVFGNRRLGTTIRKEVVDYCETFIADAWGHFRKRLFYPRDVDANQREINAEDGVSRE